MLASLLPGLRDLRAPLAAGYVWLAAGWLYFAPQLPASVNEADGVLKDIYRVADAGNPHCDSGRPYFHSVPARNTLDRSIDSSHVYNLISSGSSDSPHIRCRVDSKAIHQETTAG